MLFLNFSVDFKGMWTSDVDIVSLKPPVTHQSPRGPEAAAAYNLDFVNALVPLFQMPLPVENVSRVLSSENIYLPTNVWHSSTTPDSSVLPPQTRITRVFLPWTEKYIISFKRNFLLQLVLSTLFCLGYHNWTMILFL